jgi:hypothetical protein
MFEVLCCVLSSDLVLVQHVACGVVALVQSCFEVLACWRCVVVGVGVGVVFFFFFYCVIYLLLSYDVLRTTDFFFLRNRRYELVLFTLHT